MATDVYLIGVTNGAANALMTAIADHGAMPHLVGGPGEIPISTSPHALAIVPFFGPETFARTIDALYRRGITACIALVPSPEFRSCAEAFRAGADDVISEPASTQEVFRMIDFLVAGGNRRAEPMQVRSLEEVERDAIAAALEACRGQVSLTARRLGIGRSTLYRKIEQYELASQR